jgi:hypothetical protein
MGLDQASDEGKVDRVMRKLMLAMLALFALGAFFAATASAEETLLAEWLWNGSAVGELLSVTTTGGLTLEDTKTIAGAASVLCTATADGSVGANGEDETTEILNALGVAVAALGGLALLGTGAATGEGSECKTTKTCGEGTVASPIEVNPIGLPWHSLLFLDAVTGKFLVLFTGTGGLIGYMLLCLVLLLNTEDTCTSEDFEVEVFNDPEDVAIPAGAETSPLALCTQSNELTGRNIADALTFILPLEGLLSVSSE